MRTAFGMAIPFAIGWAVCGSILWGILLDQYATSLPAWVLDSRLGWALTLVYAVFGAVFAVVLRVFAWMLLERRPPPTPARDVPVRRDIPLGRDWRQV
jgi:hypothetical protein